MTLSIFCFIITVFVFCKHVFNVFNILVLKKMKNKIAVIGGGPGGYSAAIRAAQLGGEVTLINNDQLGGTCLNYGCIPSKMLKKTSQIFSHTNASEHLGITFERQPVFSMAAHVQYQQQVIGQQQKGVAALLKKNSVNHIQGEAKIKGINKLEILAGESSHELEWDKLIIAAGSSPLSIKAFAFDHHHILSSTDILRLEQLPKSLIIIGGGVIGCEFGSIFHDLGCKVTIIEAAERLLPLPSLDEEISKNLHREFKKNKMSVLTGHMVNSVEIVDDLVHCNVSSTKTGKTATIEAEKALVAIGRKSNAPGLHLDAIGIQCDAAGWITVNNRMQTSAEDVFAIGDITGPHKPMLAHVATAEGEIAAENCFSSNKSMRYDNIPSAVFTSPEIGSVGISEREALQQDLEISSETVLYRSLGKSHATGEIAGFAKLVFTKNDQRIVGVQIIGARATDIISEAALAVTINAKLSDLIDTVHAHPTFAEIMRETALKATGSPLHG